MGDGEGGAASEGGLGVKGISVEDAEKHEFVSQLRLGPNAHVVKFSPPTDQQQPGGLPLVPAEREPSMKDLLAAITGLTTNVGGVKTSLSEFRIDMTGFRFEMSGVKADVVVLKDIMVTKEILAEEVRLQIGQQSVSSANSSEVSALRKQISKMDPAQKGIRYVFEVLRFADQAATIDRTSSQKVSPSRLLLKRGLIFLVPYQINPRQGLICPP